MLLFRSEEEARTWMTDRGESLVACMTLDQCWTLSETWYAGRLDRHYQRPPLDSFQELLRRAGLVGEAWSLTGPSRIT
jgi:hypothetical protein